MRGWKKGSLLLATVLVLSMTACGGKDDVAQSSVEVVQSQEKEAQNTQEVPAESSSESEKASSSGSKEEEWVPEAFEQTGAIEIDYIAPAVHTGNQEQCTFLWNYTEADLKNWFTQKYADIEGTNVEQVFNGQQGNAYERMYNLRFYVADSEESAILNVQTGIYNESVAHAVSLEVECHELEAAKEETRQFLEMFGFGDYAEEFINKDNGVMGVEIPTENGLGYYNVSCNYYLHEYDQTYSFITSIYFEDFGYMDNAPECVPVEFEYWGDYYALEDYLPNSSFDTSSVEAFVGECHTYSEQVYNHAFDRDVKVRQNFGYSRDDSGKIYDVDFSYTYVCEDKNAKAGNISVNHKMEDDRHVFYVSAAGVPAFENKSRYYNVSDLTETEILELSQGRYDIMKKIDSSIDWTADDLVNSFRYNELKEDCDKQWFEGAGYKYLIINNFDNLSLSGDFSAK